MSLDAVASGLGPTEDGNRQVGRYIPELRRPCYSLALSVGRRYLNYTVMALHIFEGVWKDVVRR